MSEASTTPIENGMNQLRQRYIGQLSERISELERLYTLGQAHNIDGDERLLLRSLAHKLAGSGTIFGFPEISAAGMQLDQALLEQPEWESARYALLLEQLVAVCKKALTITV